MLPTFEPDGMLVRALTSVLAQAPAHGMQITVVDDASRSVDLEKMVRGADPTGRVEILRHDDRLGLGGNWNRALAAARGEMIHLLHQDDYVLPGFYARMDRIFRRAPHLGMAFSRCRIVDAHDRLLKHSSRLRWTSGIIDGWLPIIARRQRVHCPAVIVPRRTYEHVGGYRTDLRHTLDWEMWVRIASRHAVGYEPRPLATYCRHPGNETTRLAACGHIWPDVMRAIDINAGSLPESHRAALVRASAGWHARSARRAAAKHLAQGDAAAARRALIHAELLAGRAARHASPADGVRPTPGARRAA
jgi:hypothetical protein